MQAWDAVEKRPRADVVRWVDHERNDATPGLLPRKRHRQAALALDLWRLVGRLREQDDVERARLQLGFAYGVIGRRIRWRIQGAPHVGAGIAHARGHALAGDAIRFGEADEDPTLAHTTPPLQPRHYSECASRRK